MMAGRVFQAQTSRPPVSVSAEDADLIRKVRRILRAGKNVEIKQDAKGIPKVFKVSREIEQ